LLVLIAAGEAVFALPFVLPRVFRPTILDVFELSNTQLGTAMSVYGMVAMVAYFLGGPLADRFSPRRMMAFALWGTALGGLYLASIPSYPALVALYGWWGLTTILLFWAGLLRTTREWGGESTQGRAYGFLDGGRGLFAALLSTAAVALFALLVNEEAALALRRSALQRVIVVYAGLTALAGVGVWWLVPQGRSQDRAALRLADVVRVARLPNVWLQGLIVICAYVGYKGTDDLSLLTRDALGYSDVDAAWVGTLAFWIRPVAAATAGLVADRIGGWKTVAVSFALLMASNAGVAFGVMHPAPALLFSAIVGSCCAVYALRGVYFALFPEAGVPVAVTGTAVGLVSVVGYTPDVFFGPMMGWLLDRSPGAAGHQHLFAVLAGFALLGLAATLVFSRFVRTAEPAREDH